MSGCSSDWQKKWEDERDSRAVDAQCEAVAPTTTNEQNNGRDDLIKRVARAVPRTARHDRLLRELQATTIDELRRSARLIDVSQQKSRSQS